MREDLIHHARGWSRLPPVRQDLRDSVVAAAAGAGVGVAVGTRTASRRRCDKTYNVVEPLVELHVLLEMRQHDQAVQAVLVNAGVVLLVDRRRDAARVGRGLGLGGVNVGVKGCRLTTSVLAAVAPVAATWSAGGGLLSDAAAEVLFSWVMVSSDEEVVVQQWVAKELDIRAVRTSAPGGFGFSGQ